MGIISRLYIKKFVCRYDKQVGVPYYSYTDFKGLKQEEYSFTNSKGIELKYFFFITITIRKRRLFYSYMV